MGTPRQPSVFQTGSAQQAHFRLLNQGFCVRVTPGTLLVSKLRHGIRLMIELSLTRDLEQIV
jgi:hypothetical protein